MSEDRKSKQNIGMEMKGKAQVPQPIQVPQMPQPIPVPEMPEMPQMPQVPQMPQMPQMPQVPQMGQMHGCMPQPCVICCPYLMNVQCPMLQSCDMHGAGYMMGNQCGSAAQPQFMYGSGMYAPYTGDTMNYMQY